MYKYSVSLFIIMLSLTSFMASGKVYHLVDLHQHGTIEVSAHRGASFLAPENTYASHVKRSNMVQPV